MKGKTVTIILWLIVILLLATVSALSVSAVDFIEDNIEEALQTNEEVSVIVLLNDNPLEGSSLKGKIVGSNEIKNQLGGLYEKKKIIKEKQEKVLSRLNSQLTGSDLLAASKPSFRLKHKYATVNSFSGKITKEGLEKIRNDPDVKGIFIDKKMHMTIHQSIPQINANAVWAIQQNSINITGAGETICIIDTGVDYTHPALGGCNITRISLNGTNESYVNESAHNYTDNFDYTWKITKPGYENIAVHFKNISTEPKYDYIFVYDNNSRILATYSGSHQNLWSPYSEGDTIYVRLKTDEAKTDYGFYIDYVINGTTNTTYDWGNCSKVIGGWDIVNSDGDPIDDNSHGTHCAGIASSKNGTYRGVAPDTKIVAIKSLSSSGGGYASDIIAGIDWCTNQSETLNISVISMSLGDNTMHNTYCNGDPIAPSINSAVAEGILVAVAAGNCDWIGASCISGINSPACIENATPVGGVNNADSIQYQRGNILDILAPGVSIYSTVPNNLWSYKSGTSMSTPHVAGAATLIKQFVRLQNGTDISHNEIEIVLNATGKRVYDSGTGRYYSRIDIYAAIGSLDTTPPKFNNALNYSTGFRIYSNFTSNISIDEISIDYYIFYTNASGIWENKSVNVSGVNYHASEVKDIGLVQGSEVCWYYWANDTAGNSNQSDIFCFIVANSPPRVTQIGIQPILPNTTNNLNCTYNAIDFDNHTINAVFDWYLNGTSQSIDSQVLAAGNTSMVDRWSCSVNVSDGIEWTFNVSANVTILDERAPEWSNNKTSPSSGALYSPSAQYQFNVTWTDNALVDMVLIRHNFNGATQDYNITGNISSEYYYGITGIAAGTYNWSMKANDTADNWNYTDSWTYSIAKGQPSCSLTFNDTSPITYGSIIEAYCSCTNPETSEKLYRNDTQIANASSQLLASGSYNYVCNISETQNYTFASNNSNFIVNKAGSVVNLLIDGVDNDKIAERTSTVNLTVQVIKGQSFVQILENGTIIDSGESNRTLLRQYNSTGDYNITVYYPETENYTSSSETHILTIEDTTPPNITSKSPSGSTTDTTPDLTVSTDEPAICRYSTQSNLSFENMTLFSTTNATTSVSTLSLSTGSYTYYIKCKDRLNNTMASAENVSFTITSPPSSGGGGSSGCSDECDSGETGCTGPSARAVCQYSIQYGCWKWAEIACGENEECDGGECIEKACIEEWICGEWSRCENGTRTRECGDWNACGTVLFKPRTSEECELEVAEPEEEELPEEQKPAVVDEKQFGMVEETAPEARGIRAGISNIMEEIKSGELSSKINNIAGDYLWYAIAIIAVLALIIGMASKARKKQPEKKRKRRRRSLFRRMFKKKTLKDIGDDIDRIGEQIKKI